MRGWEDFTNFSQPTKSHLDCDTLQLYGGGNHGLEVLEGPGFRRRRNAVWDLLTPVSAPQGLLSSGVCSGFCEALQSHASRPHPGHSAPESALSCSFCA